MAWLTSQARRMASLLHSITLDLNPDSTEFCPWPGHHALLAVGTYQLDEASQQRLGRLHLYQMVHGSSLVGGRAHPRDGDDDAAEAEECDAGSPGASTTDEEAGEAHSSTRLRRGPAAGSGPQLLLAQQLDVPGIFDLKWSPQLLGNRRPAEMQCGGGPWLGAALADGSMRAYRLLQPSEGEEEVGRSAALAEEFRCNAFPSGGGMALSLDWASDYGCGCSPGEEGAGIPTPNDLMRGDVALSSSSGYLSLLKVLLAFHVLSPLFFCFCIAAVSFPASAQSIGC